MAVAQEQIDAAIDMLISMVVMDLGKEQGCSPSDFMPKFLKSHTASLLYDEKQKYWCYGPSYIAEMYKKEMAL